VNLAGIQLGCQCRLLTELLAPDGLRPANSQQHLEGADSQTAIKLFSFRGSTGLASVVFRLCFP
jgi:hypothetical protein